MARVEYCAPQHASCSGDDPDQFWMWQPKIVQSTGEDDLRRMRIQKTGWHHVRPKSEKTWPPEKMRECVCLSSNFFYFA